MNILIIEIMNLPYFVQKNKNYYGLKNYTKVILHGSDLDILYTSIEYKLFTYTIRSNVIVSGRA